MPLQLHCNLNGRAFEEAGCTYGATRTMNRAGTGRLWFVCGVSVCATGIGTVSFTVDDVSVMGFEIQQWLREVYTKLQGCDRDVSLCSAGLCGGTKMRWLWKGKQAHSIGSGNSGESSI
ncbi:UNVERIFIED_CONTAM: hypothetical protein Sindi_2499900 [Sesamum indicum]